MESLVIELFDKFPVLATVLSVGVASSALCTVIVNITHTPRDNEIAVKFYKIIEWVAGIVTKKAKEE